MNEKPTINPQTLPPLTKFIYTIGQLPTSYLMSMTYEEQLVWLCNYLGTQVIPAVNQNGEAVEELQNLYELLRTYVNDYFDNLDVQEEINEKLDKMVQDGSLAQIMQQYIMPYFNSFTNEVNTNISQQNTKINEIETKVDSAVSGSPLVANTLADMTDTTRVYVLTTNGHWYWYDGDSWEDGGVYQSTGVSETDPVIEDLSDKIDAISGRSRNLINETTNITVDKNHREKFLNLSNYTFESGKTYTFSTRSIDVVPSTTSNNNLIVRYYDTDSNWHAFDVQQIEEKVYSFTFTPDDIVKISFIISASVSDSTTITFTDFMLSESESYVPYIPYITAYDGEAREEIRELKNTINIAYKVASYQDLLDAIDNGGVISLVNNITLENRLNIQNKNLYIIGNGYTLSPNNSVTDHIIAVLNSKVVFDNVNFNGNNIIDHLLVGSTNSITYVNNCIFTYAHDSIIRIANNGIMHIENCDIGYSYGNDGISPADTSKVYITNCKVHDCYDEGISSHNSSYCEVINTEAYNNGYIVGTTTKGATSSFGGIHLGGGKMGIVKGCYSHNNCTYGIGLINFQDSTQIDIENCTDNIIKNNGGAGIFCTGARRMILGYNTIMNNGEAIHFGLDNTYTPTIDLVASSGIVNKNTLYGNTNNNIIIDSGADDGIVIIN